jgi:hypothetical protein
MDTYTIAEAARLVGTSRGKLYQAIRTGQLQTAPGGEADQAMTVTRAVLRAAGFPVPEPAAPGTPPAPGPDTPGPTAGGSPDGERQHDQGDRALIAHLERALPWRRPGSGRGGSWTWWRTSRGSAGPSLQGFSQRLRPPPPCAPPRRPGRP